MSLTDSVRNNIIKSTLAEGAREIIVGLDAVYFDSDHMMEHYKQTKTNARKSGLPTGDCMAKLMVSMVQD